jgi:hypothetical protein
MGHSRAERPEAWTQAIHTSPWASVSLSANGGIRRTLQKKKKNRKNKSENKTKQKDRRALQGCLLCCHMRKLGPEEEGLATKLVAKQKPEPRAPSLHPGILL